MGKSTSLQRYAIGYGLHFELSVIPEANFSATTLQNTSTFAQILEYRAGIRPDEPFARLIVKIQFVLIGDGHGYQDLRSEVLLTSISEFDVFLDELHALLRACFDGCVPFPLTALRAPGKKVAWTQKES